MSAITIGSLTSLQLGWTLIRVSKKPRNQILFPKNCKMHFFVCRKYNWLSPRIPYQNGINTHRDSVKVTVSSSLSNRAKDVSQTRNCNPALQLLFFSGFSSRQMLNYPFGPCQELNINCRLSFPFRRPLHLHSPAKRWENWKKKSRKSIKSKGPGERKVK